MVDGMVSNRFKNIVSVDKTSEKRMYQIMSELKLYGESVVDKPSREWNNTFIKFSNRTKELQNRELIDALWIKRDRQKVTKQMVRLPKNVDVIEIAGPKIVQFKFTRRKK